MPKRYIIKAHSNAVTGSLRWGVFDVSLQRFTFRNFASSRLAASSAEKLNVLFNEQQARNKR
jgi:hypothetical protein